MSSYLECSQLHLVETLWPLGLEAALHLEASVRVGDAGHKGRGLFATVDLAPGTLLLWEKALFEWEASEVGGVMVALRSRQSESAVGKRAWAALSRLAPLSLESASADALASAKRRYGPRLIEKAEGFEERLRLALVFQMNGTDSSLFARASLFNNSCSFAANCLKVDSKGEDGKNVTRVYVVKPVKAGDELTVSYEAPSSSLRRRRRLRAKYDFDCGCAGCRGVFDATKANEEAMIDDDLNILEEGENNEKRLLSDRAELLANHTARFLGDAQPLTIRARRLAFSSAHALVALKDDDLNDLIADDTEAALSRGLALLEVERKALGPDHLDLANTASLLADLIDITLYRFRQNESLTRQTWQPLLLPSGEGQQEEDTVLPVSSSDNIGQTLYKRLELLGKGLRADASRITDLYRQRFKKGQHNNKAHFRRPRPPPAASNKRGALSSTVVRCGGPGA